MTTQGFHGRCHCGDVELLYTTTRKSTDIEPRACACSFCRKHNARCISGPDDRVEITERKRGALERYRFGLRTADFLLCRHCGVYLGALLDDGGRAFATINVNCFDEQAEFTKPATSVNFDSEDAAARRERRRTRWTPVVAQPKA